MSQPPWTPWAIPPGERSTIAATIDHLPVLGSSRCGRVRYILGCNGHGIALGTYLGAAMADTLLGRSRIELDVFRRWLPPIPTRTLRGVAFKAVASPLERRDASIDREIRAARKP